MWCASLRLIQILDQEMALATAYEVPRAEPVTIAVADQTPAINAVEHNDCNCGVPSTASRVVKAVSLDVMGSKNHVRWGNKMTLQLLYIILFYTQQHLFEAFRRPTTGVD